MNTSCHKDFCGGLLLRAYRLATSAPATGSKLIVDVPAVGYASVHGKHYPPTRLEQRLDKAI